MEQEDPAAAIQTAFVNYVTCLPGMQNPADLKDELDQRFAHRIDIYRLSFRGRAVSSLSDTVLQPVCRVFGSDNVKEVVGRYFAVQPPAKACMVEALAGLGGFVARATGDRYGKLFADMVALSLGYWNLLYARDPQPPPVGQKNEALTQSYLLWPSFLLIGRSDVDLHAAWRAASGSGEDELDCEDYLQGKPSGVLLVKTSPLEISSVRVSATFEPLLRLLMSGLSLDECLAELSEEEVDQIAEGELIQLLMAIF